VFHKGSFAQHRHPPRQKRCGDAGGFYGIGDSDDGTAHFALRQFSARYRVERPTFRRSATYCRSSPWLINVRARAICCNVRLGFRPNFTPPRCAAFTPARVRSEVKLLSNSANTPIICHMARPVGVVVSIGSVSEWNFTHGAEIVHHCYQVPQAAA